MNKALVKENALVQYSKRLMDFRNENGPTKHIVLDGNKGGVGKTTLCLNSSIMMRHIFNKKVAVVDLDDTQHVTATTLKARNALIKGYAEDGEDISQLGGLITVVEPFSTAVDTEELVAKFLKIIEYVGQHEYDYCIYDCGGYSSDLSYILGAYSHIHLWPLKPEPVNVRNIPRMEAVMKIINSNRAAGDYPKAKNVVMLNALKTTNNSIRNREAKDFLDERAKSGLYPRITDVQGIPDYDAYNEVISSCLGVSELEDMDSRANRHLRRWVKMIIKQSETEGW